MSARSTHLLMCLCAERGIRLGAGWGHCSIGQCTKAPMLAPCPNLPSSLVESWWEIGMSSKFSSNEGEPQLVLWGAWATDKVEGGQARWTQKTEATDLALVLFPKYRKHRRANEWTRRVLSNGDSGTPEHRWDHCNGFCGGKTCFFHNNSETLFAYFTLILSWMYSGIFRRSMLMSLFFLMATGRSIVLLKNVSVLISNIVSGDLWTKTLGWPLIFKSVKGSWSPKVWEPHSWM